MQIKPMLDDIILLRAAAIILVVFGHATRSIDAPNPHMFNPHVIPWGEMVIHRYIYSFHMPLFFWISGFVFHLSTVENRQQDITIARQFFKKAKRLILPMYATSLFILLPTIFLFGFLNGSVLAQIKLFALGLNNDHLWFLKTLFLIFLIIIPLYYFMKSESRIFYIMVLIIWCVVYAFKHFLPESMILPIKYFPFFIIGCLSRKHQSDTEKVNFLFLFTIFFSLHLLIFLSGELVSAYLTEDLVWFLSAFLGIYFMYSLVHVSVNYLKLTKLWKIIKIIDAKSYSIYLFHVSFIYVVLFLDYGLKTHIAGIRIIISFIAGLFLSMILHDLFSKNKILSRLFAIQH